MASLEATFFSSGATTRPSRDPRTRVRRIVRSTSRRRNCIAHHPLRDRRRRGGRRCAQPEDADPERSDARGGVQQGRQGAPEIRGAVRTRSEAPHLEKARQPPRHPAACRERPPHPCEGWAAISGDRLHSKGQARSRGVHTSRSPSGRRRPTKRPTRRRSRSPSRSSAALSSAFAGRIAQRESARFTRGRSLVRSQLRPLGPA
jgi:hypothetical protein